MLYKLAVIDRVHGRCINKKKFVKPCQNKFLTDLIAS